jgi:PilZ domain
MPSEKTNRLGALGRLFRERRKHPRRRPREGEGLLVGVSAVGADESELLFARVHDISEGGLSAAVEGGEQQLEALREARALSLIITLPEGTLAARAALVYVRPPDPERAGRVWLLGACFTDMSSVDLGCLRAYLVTLT